MAEKTKRPIDLNEVMRRAAVKRAEKDPEHPEQPRTLPTFERLPNDEPEREINHVPIHGGGFEGDDE